MTPSVTPSNTITPTPTSTVIASQTVTPTLTPTNSPTIGVTQTPVQSPTPTPVIELESIFMIAGYDTEFGNLIDYREGFVDGDITNINNEFTYGSELGDLVNNPQTINGNRILVIMNSLRNNSYYFKIVVESGVPYNIFRKVSFISERGNEEFDTEDAIVSLDISGNRVWTWPISALLPTSLFNES